MAGGLRVFGHPVHALLVHAPMGLLGTAPVWDAIGVATSQASFFAIAFWTVSAGVALGLVAATAGFFDFAALEKDSEAEKPALRHMTLMLTALGAYGLSLVFRNLSTPPEGARLFATLGCDLVGLLTLALGGYFGGELVYRHGVGQARPHAPPP